MAVAFLLVEQGATSGHAYVLPLPLPPDEAKSAPAVYTGMLDGTFDPETYGDDFTYFIGSGTLIRRHTVLTAGHVLYSGKDGFATNVRYLPQGKGGRAPNPYSSLRGLALAVLGGYEQEVAPDLGRASQATALDLGRLILLDPAPENAWADWAAVPNALTDSSSHFLFFGWHTDADLQDFALVRAESDAAHLPNKDYSNVFYSKDFFSYPGTSGGPVYARGPATGNRLLVVAEHTYGLGLEQIPDGAKPDSGCRAIDSTARRLLVDGEYKAGLIVGGRIKSPAQVKAGEQFVVKVGARYKDGKVVGKQYDEFVLVAQKSLGVTVAKVANNRFLVRFPQSLRPGTKVRLRLRHDAGTSRPLLEKFDVTVL